MNSEMIFKQEAFEIIGRCMEVHNALGHGFSEIVYKDALEIAFSEDDILYIREAEYKIRFRGFVLPHFYYADFLVSDCIILEVKCVAHLTDEHMSQTINYLKTSGCKLALLVNFARGKLEYKRVVL